MVVPRDVVYEKFRVPNIVKSYSRIPDVVDVPYLVQIQVDSYEVFKQESLRELFDEISPIADFTGNRLEMRFTDYSFGEPKYDQDECRERDATFSAPLKVNVQLLVKETGEIKEQEIFMGDFPLMTEKGTFIINGAERVVVSQLVRSPGVYLTKEHDNTSGRFLCYAKLIPNRGAWLEFETSNKNVIAVKVDRKRKIPVTTLIRAIDEPELLPKHPSNAAIKEIQEKIAAAKTEREADKLRQQLLQHLGTNERVAAIFADIDNDKNEHQFIKSTLDRDTPATTKEEALLEFYRRLRPGDPPTIDNAKQLIFSLFFNPRRYDLGKVGRYKVNKRLGRQDATQERVLAPADLVAIVREIIRLNNNIGKSDDIDHLGNRRVRTVGELIQNQFRIGLLRMERVIRERMTITDPQETAPSQLINIRPVVAAIKEFFGGSQLSQFMDQTNPLAELTHKRRLSALGPGGLSRDRAGFDVRDVHFSHYGRICPIETPEGPNIGLIGSLATFGQVNPYGFIETPYRRVYRDLPKDSPKLIGHFVREDVKDAKGKVIVPAGTEIDEAVAKRLAGAEDGSVTIRPYVSDEVEYLSADEEEKYIVAQANSPLDEKGHFLTDRLEARTDNFIIASPLQIDYMDLSPKQIVSVAASLIPFLEHDDANRALMGANMQRQAVPLVRPEIPLVGTGMDYKTAVDSGQVILAEDDGEVLSVTGDAIKVAYDSGKERTYRLNKFIRSNQGTCINQRAIVRRGQKLERGETLADSSSTDSGELALGQTLLCAFMSWEGYNFEDAIIISERVAQDDKFTSIHVEKHEVEARDTKLGPEEITRDIPNVGEESLVDLDEYGIVRVGAEVLSGDILVGKITPKGETELTAEEKLLRAIFGEKAREVKDTSLRVPHGERGKVIETRFFARPDNDAGRPQHGAANHNCRWPHYAQITDELAAGVQAMVRISIAQRRKVAEGDKMAGRHGNKGVISRILPVEDMPHLVDGTPVDIILNPIGVPSRMNIGQVLETHLGWAARRMGFRAISPVFDGGNPKTIEDALCRAWICEQAGALLEEPANISGNGRNGHHTEGAGERVDEARVQKWLKDRGYAAADVFDDSRVGEAARVGLELWLEQPENKEWLEENAGVKRIKGRSYHDLDELSEKVLLATGRAAPTYGKQVLLDGRSGDQFDQPV
ncbi:MAG TPA: DNA-directed RNA polymerase subunit beta, partial [Dehalococcoidia bacterium]|nr:DNA-directed RNA polymerase subunit beta [Dehalococcoidia bacterium]